MHIHLFNPQKIKEKKINNGILSMTSPNVCGARLNEPSKIESRRQIHALINNDGNYSVEEFKTRRMFGWHARAWKSQNLGGTMDGLY